MDFPEVAGRAGDQAKEATVEVVFSAEGDAQILGVTTVESLGYRVNPITEELEYVGLLAI